MKFELFLFWMLLFLFLKIENTQASQSNNLSNSPELATQTNFALRQTAHQLLSLTGNDSSTVLPVQQISEHIFLIPIPQSFNYDTLPYLLHHALSNFGMEQEEYYVSIKDCETDTLVLGYHSTQFRNKEVPCIGREQYADCNQFFLTFPNRRHLASRNYWLLALLLIPIGILLLFFFRKKSPMTKSKQEAQTVIQAPLIETTLLSFGQCKLDVVNQYVFIKDTKTGLTFREAKLLHYFGSHLNQLLQREELLEQVWEDEGIIVGRSLDVFVSRLRKILKPDTSLSIKTVHGIGYRMEVLVKSQIRHDSTQI